MDTEEDLVKTRCTAILFSTVLAGDKFLFAWNFFYKSAILPSAMEKVVREQRVLYGKHMDITSYDGKRETHNPAGITLERFLVYIYSLTRYQI
jgi:hypothetical protein